MCELNAESDSKMASTKPTSDPKGVLTIQSTASLMSLSIYAGIMILHAMVVRAGLAYAGLVGGASTPCEFADVAIYVDFRGVSVPKNLLFF